MMKVMKVIASGLVVLGLLVIQASEADAAACAAGPHRRDASVRAAQWALRLRLRLSWRRGCEACLRRPLLLARRRSHLPLTLIAVTRLLKASTVVEVAPRRTSKEARLSAPDVLESLKVSGRGTTTHFQ